MFALPSLATHHSTFKVDKSFRYSGDFVPRHKSISSPSRVTILSRTSGVREPALPLKKSNQNGAQHVRRKRVWELAR